MSLYNEDEVKKLMALKVEYKDGHKLYSKVQNSQNIFKEEGLIISLAPMSELKEDGSLKEYFHGTSNEHYLRSDFIAWDMANESNIKYNVEDFEEAFLNNLYIQQPSRFRGAITPGEYAVCVSKVERTYSYGPKGVYSDHRTTNFLDTYVVGNAVLSENDPGTMTLSHLLVDDKLVESTGFLTYDKEVLNSGVYQKYTESLPMDCPPEETLTEATTTSSSDGSDPMDM